MPEPGTPSIPQAHSPAAMLWGMFRRMPDPACILDAHLRVVACNEKWADLLGGDLALPCDGTPFTEMIRRAVARGCLVIDTDAEDWTRRVLAETTGGILRVSGTRAMRVQRAPLGDGGTIVTLVDIGAPGRDAPVRAADGGEEPRARLAALSQQVTDLAERLASVRAEAERAKRTKSEFLANMSHELRSPLNAIIGFSEIMKDELFGALGSAQYREYAVDIWSSGKHLLDLINDILDLSKIEAGRLDLMESRVDLGATISACIRLMAGRAQQGEVSVRSTLGSDGVVLWADERKIKQVLINLLTNAIKFTKPGGRVKIHVGDARDMLDLRVTDTGIGMAKEDLPVALAAFGQIDSSLARKHEGTGLGLPLCKALVELHGGTLVIESEVGIGTTVIVKLPASRVVARPRYAAA